MHTMLQYYMIMIIIIIIIPITFELIPAESRCLLEVLLMMIPKHYLAPVDLLQVRVWTVFGLSHSIAHLLAYFQSNLGMSLTTIQTNFVPPIDLFQVLV